MSHKKHHRSLRRQSRPHPDKIAAVRAQGRVIRSMPHKDSSACGKILYEQYIHAAHAALLNSRARAIPLRVYRCDVCNGFHLTKSRKWAKPQVEPEVTS